MSKQQYEYQVSPSVNADREHFSVWGEALKLAKSLSMRQAHPVYIEVIEVDTEQPAPFWYTVTKGEVTKQGQFARKGAVL